MTARRFGARPPLARLLLLASRWFDEQSRAELERRGWPKLSAAQTAVFAHLSDFPVPPAELARRLGNTRQATSDLVQGLIRLGLLEMLDDPARRGGRLVCVTQRGVRLAQDGYVVLLKLEEQLADAEVVKQLHTLLAGLPAVATGPSKSQDP
ncbi:MarR family winged helix-turn-helix transcriptional regulator [Blastococcus sp. LR1]|uniref:MarR family winged helix-turn-helix transcriptional regulator n=1 Tax=Blastococcus sp. LR1 TaxID=2877000 RepID=UPI001CCEB383|nr:MarR family winged helix-turn-helix transcriptional regulator [Blastococcus sp. LR1]MCA0143988.1 MarR family winged helix-turn-helix transcriptional regulator [Blastococcus sp. LR1]